MIVVPKAGGGGAVGCDEGDGVSFGFAVGVFTGVEVGCAVAVVPGVFCVVGDRLEDGAVVPVPIDVVGVFIGGVAFVIGPPDPCPFLLASNATLPPATTTATTPAMPIIRARRVILRWCEREGISLEVLATGSSGMFAGNGNGSVWWTGSVGAVCVFCDGGGKDVPEVWAVNARVGGVDILVLVSGVVEACDGIVVGSTCSVPSERMYGNGGEEDLTTGTGYVREDWDGFAGSCLNVGS